MENVDGTIGGRMGMRKFYFHNPSWPFGLIDEIFPSAAGAVACRGSGL